MVKGSHSRKYVSIIIWIDDLLVYFIVVAMLQFIVEDVEAPYMVERSIWQPCSRYPLGSLECVHGLGLAFSYRSFVLRIVET